jgi:hypothetical protein
MRKLRTHLTYANVMSTLAVFLLLGGASAYAAKKQTQKIGSTQIKASAVIASKIKNEAVTTAKLKNAAVTNGKLAAAAVGTANIAAGAVGTGNIAADAVTGAQVNESTLGEVPSANSANPGVFAKVNSNGITSPNVHEVGATGVYCITVPSFTPRGGQATPQVSEAVTAQLAVGGTGSCPAPAAQVSTLNVGGTATPSAFYVELYH